MNEKRKPLVSICCAAYNHEEYIEDALRGFLMQECDFEYEILIHDDASTDKTAEIIRRYEERFPDKIFPIYQTENQYSQGKKYSDLNYERVKGKYVAICEGDDCWLDKTKLSKQIKLMEENPTFGLCFHPAIVTNMSTNRINIIGKYLYQDGVIDIRDIILKKKAMIPYASCVITKEVLDEVLEFKSKRPYLTLGDIYMQIFGSLKAEGALYINEVMSLYRFLTPESWSLSWINSFERQSNHLMAIAKSFQDLNKITQYKYEEAFELSIIKRVFQLISLHTLNSGSNDKLQLKSFPNIAIQYINQLFKNLEELKKNNERYILYGAGTTAKLILEILEDKIDFIVDADLEKHNSVFFNKKVIHSDYFKNNYVHKKIIISLIGRYENVIKNLGLEKEKFIFFDVDLASKKILRNLEF